MIKLPIHLAGDAVNALVVAWVQASFLPGHQNHLLLRRAVRRREGRAASWAIFLGPVLRPGKNAGINWD